MQAYRFLIHMLFISLVTYTNEAISENSTSKTPISATILLLNSTNPTVIRAEINSTILTNQSTPQKLTTISSTNITERIKGNSTSHLPISSTRSSLNSTNPTVTMRINSTILISQPIKQNLTTTISSTNITERIKGNSTSHLPISSTRSSLNSTNPTMIMGINSTILINQSTPKKLTTISSTNITERIKGSSTSHLPISTTRSSLNSTNPTMIMGINSTILINQSTPKKLTTISSTNITERLKGNSTSHLPISSTRSILNSTNNGLITSAINTRNSMVQSTTVSSAEIKYVIIVLCKFKDKPFMNAYKNLSSLESLQFRNETFMLLQESFKKDALYLLDIVLNSLENGSVKANMNFSLASNRSFTNNELITSTTNNLNSTFGNSVSDIKAMVSSNPSVQSTVSMASNQTTTSGSNFSLFIKVPLLEAVLILLLSGYHLITSGRNIA